LVSLGSFILVKLVLRLGYDADSSLTINIPDVFLLVVKQRGDHLVDEVEGHRSV
jgi:hypothetical protein